ncbi:TPA: hypothetical protein HA235_04810 [Candidatus Woesearchaeota archaeon]|nr:hypothetical protein [Candidatus Woesearchaeota archaeon]HIH32001.1 hypothetical protein [Candidatus Woesearchaeota archaeon]HIH54883.1 hypothetical protein [Candidatus Woesearchaeota archaeon]HIJ02020.1 hypothetical protein [Candidatus Woesearchaeota archaeon]HIJ13281.1 hypothetical protein [Candidatus Woesearchaeota archaeon]
MSIFKKRELKLADIVESLKEKFKGNEGKRFMLSLDRISYSPHDLTPDYSDSLIAPPSIISIVYEGISAHPFVEPDINSKGINRNIDFILDNYGIKILTPILNTYTIDGNETISSFESGKNQNLEINIPIDVYKYNTKFDGLKLSFI